MDTGDENEAGGVVGAGFDDVMGAGHENEAGGVVADLADLLMTSGGPTTALYTTSDYSKWESFYSLAIK